MEDNSFTSILNAWVKEIIDHRLVLVGAFDLSAGGRVPAGVDLFVVGEVDHPTDDIEGVANGAGGLAGILHPGLDCFEVGKLGNLWQGEVPDNRLEPQFVNSHLGGYGLLVSAVALDEG